MLAADGTHVAAAKKRDYGTYRRLLKNKATLNACVRGRGQA